MTCLSSEDTVAMDEETAIEVHKAYKYFQRDEYVLKGLNMKVTKGTIYSLLGPSGCGKTTLLSCLVGLEKLTSGDIRLHTDQPKDIGYMPQDISLHPVLTMNETFHFYGTLYGLDSTAIQNRLCELKNLLDLPKLNPRIVQLSGGEQRRISLGVSLFHNPYLIILDEPTVGLDPILHDSVWEYLFKLTKKEGKTILITTHYIEEARSSNKVGLMRDGVLMVQENPNILMTKMGCSSLEKAFLQLCERQNEENPNDTATIGFNKPCNSDKSSTLPIKYTEYFNYNRFRAQLKKNYIWSKRNVIMMFFLLLLPASQSLLFCMSFGRYPTSLAIGIYSEEINLDHCFSPTEIHYEDKYNNCTLRQPFSCFYKNYLQQSVQVVEYFSLESGLHDSYKNKVWGIIHIPVNFTEAFLTRINLGIDSTDKVLSSSRIEVRMDSTSYVIMHHLRKQLLKSLKTSMKLVTDACNIPTSVGQIPIKFFQPFYEGDPLVGAGSELAGFIIGFCFYFGLMFTSGALLNEKLTGVQNRNFVAGMTLFEMILAHMVIQILLLTLQTVIMLMISYHSFEYSLIGDFKLVMALLYCVGFVGVALGVLLTNLFKSSLMQTYAVIGATLAVFNLGGVIWPQEGVHMILRSWLWAVPTIPAIDSLRALAAKGFPLSHPAVYYGFLSCLLWSIIFILVTIIIVRTKKTI